MLPHSAAGGHQPPREYTSRRPISDAVCSPVLPLLLWSQVYAALDLTGPFR
jgi:hypothetical protein